MISSSLFVEGDEIIRRLDEVHPFTQLVAAEKNGPLRLGEHFVGLSEPYSYVVTSLENYQDKPHILDSHAERISRKIIEFLRTLFDAL